jgi:outer membrane protein TolC
MRFGVTMDLPLLSWSGGAIHRAQLTAQQRAAERQAVVRRLEASAPAARRRFEAAARRARFFKEELVPRARSVEELSRLAHALGKTPLLGVLQAQKDLAADEGDALKAMQQAHEALADLEEAFDGAP